MAYSVSFIEGVEHSKRSVAFLRSDGDGWVNAGDYFFAAGKTEQQNLKSKISYWQGGLKRNRHYHGWDKSDFKGQAKDCFVFKMESAR